MRFNGQIAPSGSYGNGAGDGVGYIVLPPAGAWPGVELLAPGHEKAYYRDRLAYPQLAGQETVVPSEVGFVTLEIAGKQLTLTAYGMGDYAQPLPAHVIDTIIYTKN